jgi:hypothetical protein
MATVNTTGLAELREQLRNLPAHLTEEAGAIVNRAADDVEAQIKADYHTRSGAMVRGVKKKKKSIGQFGVMVQVSSTAYHAWMVENGTAARHTAKGVPRGAAEPKHVVIPAAERRRPQMYDELKAMIAKEGLTVTGNGP